MTSRDRTILVVAVSVAAVVAAWMFVVSPRRDQAGVLAGQVTTVQTQLQDLQTTLANHIAAKSSFARSYAQLTRLGEAVPADDDVPSLLYQLQSAAQTAGVDFRTIQLTPGGTSQAGASSSTGALPPGVAVGLAGFPSENFQFTFQGNFFKLSNFFARLENLVISNGTSLAVSGRLLTLNSINLQPAPSGFPAITAAVTATAYVTPAQQGLLAGATAAGPSTTTSATTAAVAPRSATATATAGVAPGSATAAVAPRSVTATATATASGAPSAPVVAPPAATVTP